MYYVKAQLATLQFAPLVGVADEGGGASNNGS
jgi:hypothetical protein